MKKLTTQERKHAIVMGGSMAGLLTARVLSDHFVGVTIVERDAFPDGAAHRRGVPQARHTHGLLASGCEVLEEFFPGISGALRRRGAVSADLARDFRWFFEGGCLARFASDLNGLLLSRPLLEAAVRERVLRLPNVRRCDNAVVDGLTFDPRSRTVTGIRIGDEALAADLVVDAMGRGSRTPQWLKAVGYQRPREDAVYMALGYTTRFFRRSPGDLGGDLGAVIPPTPDGKKGGVMIAQEGDRWAVTLMSHFGDQAPEEIGGFIDFARTLPAPYIHEVIRHAEPLGVGTSTRFPASVRRRYEKLSAFPAGYLVVGDAMCSFNPIYGQGMSVAALEAVELERTLLENSKDLARRFFARAAKVVDNPWSIAVGNDLRMPEAVGQRTIAGRFINWYISKLHRAGHSDGTVAFAFQQASNLLAPPASILHPRVALRVLWKNLVVPAKNSERAPYALRAE